MVKNPNWQQTGQLTISKRDQGELNSGLPRTTPAASSVLVQCDLNGKSACIQYNVSCTYHAKVETKLLKLMSYDSLYGLNAAAVHFIRFTFESEKIRNPQVSWEGLLLRFNRKMKCCS